MDFTITENPYVKGKTLNVLYMDDKVAKMNEKTKLPNLKQSWQVGLEASKKVVEQNSVPTNFNNVVVNSNSDSILEKLGAKSLDYNMNANEEKSNKLKVNSIVISKTFNYYDKQNKKAIENVVKEEVKEEKNEPVVDTRMSRLERTGELNTVTPIEEEVHKTNNIINIPRRFENNPISNNPYEALINDTATDAPVTRESIRNEDNNLSRGAEQNKGGDPNLYTKLVHGNNDTYGGSEISIKLQEARNKLSTANEERDKARMVNANLEEEVNNVRMTLERLKKDRALQEQKELDNTLQELKNAKTEILEETRKYDNLQEELAELIRQRDALLNNDNYSKAA